MNLRHYTFLDQILNQIDYGLNTLFATPISSRKSPGTDFPESTLLKEEQKQSANMMRVNHSGEVCAQALYQGQLMVAKNPQTQALLKQAALEETDHLAWTKQRLEELGSHTSYFNVFWYFNSLMIGAIAGLAGDRWSLGFVEETEAQVSKHLLSHLGQLPINDHKSRAIVTEMQKDEVNHGHQALLAGAKPLPSFIKTIMQKKAKVMTTLAFWF